MVDHSEIELQPDLSYEEQPVEIVDMSVKVLKGKEIPLVLISWNRQSPGEATWECEDGVRELYPHLFES